MLTTSETQARRLDGRRYIQIVRQYPRAGGVRKRQSNYIYLTTVLGMFQPARLATTIQQYLVTPLPSQRVGFEWNEVCSREPVRRSSMICQRLTSLRVPTADDMPVCDQVRTIFM